MQVHDGCTNNVRPRIIQQCDLKRRAIIQVQGDAGVAVAPEVPASHNRPGYVLPAEVLC
jgi:hypothetical protein